MEGESFWILIGAGGAFIFGVIAYVLMMYFFPEWVGITGKTALDAEKSHRGGDGQENQFWKKLGQEPVRGEESEDSAKRES